MRTHVQAPEEQSSKQPQILQKNASLLAEPQASLEDNRLQAAQLKTLQAMMGSSAQQQNHQALQAKMNASVRTQNMQTLQTKMLAGAVAQRVEDEEPLQAKAVSEAVQRGTATSARLEPTAEASRLNKKGLPNQLKVGIESLSGMSMDHVNVHYNSDKPAQLNAHAYAQGSDIHVAPGQEQHLPHEAWHVVQQAQGRVKPTMQMKGGVPVNDDVGLETEADVMGAKALVAVQMHKKDDGERIEHASSHILSSSIASAQAKSAQDSIPLPVQLMQVAQLLPTFKNMRDAIYYFEDIEEDQFEKRKKDINDLLDLSKKNDWDDLEERITYALSEFAEKSGASNKKLEIEQRWRAIDQSDPRNLAKALELLDLAQENDLDDLEDKILRYVRKTEDARDGLLSDDGLISPEQRIFLNRYRNVPSVSYPDLVFLVKAKGNSASRLSFIDACLVQMQAIGSTNVLSMSSFELLLPYSALLTSNTGGLRRMLTLAQDAVGDGEKYVALENMLELFSEFDFMPDQAILCSLTAEIDAQEFKETKRKLVMEEAEQLIQQVKENNLQAVVKAFTRRERRDYDDNKKEIHANAKMKAEERSVSEIEEIKRNVDGKFRQIEIIDGPEVYHRKKQEYHAFCSRFHFHPACTDALELTQYNLTHAAQCMNEVIAQPNLALLLGVKDITWLHYNTIIGIVGAPTVHAILANVSPQQVLALCSRPPALIALSLCHTAIPAPHLAVWTSNPATYATMCCLGAEAHFAALVTAYTPQQIIQLWQCLPGGTNGVAGTALLHTCQGIAATAGDLLSCLQLARQLNLNAGRLMTIIGALAPGRTAIQFQTALYHNALNQFSRDDNFHDWILCLGGLIAAPGSNWVIAESASEQLDGGVGTTKETWERTVTASHNGIPIRTFKIHYHPFASSAAVGSAYASPRHLKPKRSGDTRVRWESIPESIKSQISKNK